MPGDLRERVRNNAILFGVVKAGRRARVAYRSLGRSKAIRSYLQADPIPKLQLGASSNLLEGWLNSDVVLRSSQVIYLDASKPLSFRDSTFDYIFSEHQIEQLSYQQGLFMLRECSRVMKPGGVIRIATPDLETLFGLYSPKKTDIQEQYIKWIVDSCLPGLGVYKEAFVINNAFQNWGHRFLYDFGTLKGAMEHVGFRDITRYSPGSSDCEELKGIERHGVAVGNEEMNRFETLVLEGSRP